MGKGVECNIICTQPKRLSTIRLVDRVSKERNQTIGETMSLFHHWAFSIQSMDVNSCMSFYRSNSPTRYYLLWTIVMCCRHLLVGCISSKLEM